MIKSKNILYESKAQLIEELQPIKLRKPNRALIQVFCGVMNIEVIEGIIGIFNEYLPGTPLIGATTSGEIINGTYTGNRIVINITSFQYTTIESALIENDGDFETTGEKLAAQLGDQTSKALILYATGLDNGKSVDGYGLMKSMQSNLPGVTISGGQAVDNSTTEKTYVFTEKGIIDNGVVGASLNSERLTVLRTCNLNWTAIGKKMTVTSVEGNRIMTIDGRPAYDVFKHYLGQAVMDDVELLSDEFPLMTPKHGCFQVLHMTDIHEDGSMFFNYPVIEGSRVQFGYCHVGLFSDGVDNTFNVLEGEGMEVAFVYSSIRRKHLFKDVIDIELPPLKALNCSAGFFSHGQFYQTQLGKNMFSNEALTLLALSEGFSFGKDSKKIREYGKEVSRKYMILTGLQEIIKKTMSDL